MSNAAEADPEVVEPDAEPDTEPDAEPDPEEETEPEAEPETQAQPDELPPDDVQRMVARDKALERENKRHEKTLGNLYGEEWDNLSLCPLCMGEGFTLPHAPGDLPEEVLQAMDALSGRYAPPEYVEDTDYERCDHCQGHGRTITGSQNPEHVTKLCDKCQGNGFVRKQATNGNVAQFPVPTLDAPAPVGPPPTYGSPEPDDQWGRPAGHAHYGLDPRYVTG